MTALETRLDTILPTLANKEDLKDLEVNLQRDIRSNTWLYSLLPPTHRLSR